MLRTAVPRRGRPPGAGVRDPPRWGCGDPLTGGREVARISSHRPSARGPRTPLVRLASPRAAGRGPESRRVPAQRARDPHRGAAEPPMATAQTPIELRESCPPSPPSSPRFLPYCGAPKRPPVVRGWRPRAGTRAAGLERLPTAVREAVEGGGGWGGWGGKGVYFSVLNLLLLLLRVAGGEWVAGSPRTPPSARGAEGPGLERGLQPSSCWGETLGSLGMLQRPDLLCVPRWGPALVGWNLQAGSELRTGLCSPTVPFPLLPFAPLQHLLGLALRSSRGNPSSPTQGSVTVCSLWAPRPALINQLPANEALGTQQAQAICCLPPVWGSPVGVLEGLGCLFPPVRAGPWFTVLRSTNKGLGGMADLGWKWGGGQLPAR